MLISIHKQIENSGTSTFIPPNKPVSAGWHSYCCYWINHDYLWLI